MNCFLKREDAKVIQGLAVLLIFGCHFLTNYYFSEENKILYSWCGFKINNLMLELHIQKASQICRILFAFISGYAIYVNREKYASIKYCFRVVCKFLIRYWTVLFIFLLVGCLAHEPMPDLKALFYQLFGCLTSTEEILCPVFAGYIPFYITVLLFAPMWTRIFQHNIIVEILAAILLHLIFLWCVAPKITNILLYQGLNAVFATYLGGGVLCGYIVAQLDLFAKIKVKNIYLLVLLVLSAFFIPKTKSQVEEIVTAPIIIYSSVVLVRYWKKIGKVLQYLGKQSFNMWIISSIVATPKATFQKIFIWPHQAILIYVNAVIVCLLFAIPITYLQDILISKLGKRNEHIRS